ncbi:MAG: SufE family protein [Cyclobacteriaceae bacterium]|nr:SufE family protein [Cyclobacteriaceae bacterium HetDA_MAG_MS6]
MAEIKEIQEEIIEEFSMLDSDMEMTISYIMELGEQLPDFPEEQRTEENIVKGCQSKVWLTPELQDDQVVFQADSNTAITKGLVSLLIRVLSGQTAKNILENDIFFPEKIGMNRFIGTQRSNGFAAMIKQMKLYALAYEAKVQSGV